EISPCSGRICLIPSQVGNAAEMTPQQWESDIQQAKDAHIDGFALNIAAKDPNTDGILQNAYAAAEAVGDFKLFLSFDYEAEGPWPMDSVIAKINTYKNSTAQFRFQNKPLVSTFEGTGNVDDWPKIIEATGISFIPCWTSLGPSGLVSALKIVDGFFSWDAWPVGAEDITTSSDEAWIAALSGKPYMMPVSPWFYTNLPQWNKNWLWRGDDLWHD
ncbi:Glucan endo-1,3-alpha-glucosidase agn1, partial [Rasamsonia emersonii CBS 393.64]